MSQKRDFSAFIAQLKANVNAHGQIVTRWPSHFTPDDVADMRQALEKEFVIDAVLPDGFDMTVQDSKAVVQKVVRTHNAIVERTGFGVKMGEADAEVHEM